MKTIVIIYKDTKEQTVIAGNIEEYYCTEKMFFVNTDHMSYYFSLDEISQIRIADKIDEEKDCFQPKSNQQPLNEEVAKAFQFGLAFGLMDGLNAKNDDMREEELRKLEKPYYKDDPKESEVNMTYGDIFKEFCKKFPDIEVEDYRPAVPLHIPQLESGIPNAIIVWLKDGSKVIYISDRK